MARMLCRRAEALELRSEPLLAALCADLDQRQHRDEENEEDHHPEAPVGHDLVVRAAPHSDPVGGEGAWGRQRVRRHGCDSEEQVPDRGPAAHRINSTSGTRAKAYDGARRRNTAPRTRSQTSEEKSAMPSSSRRMGPTRSSNATNAPNTAPPRMSPG